MKNPICLNNHSNDTKDVLGIWKDIQVEGSLLTATPVFDTEDPNGKEVARKVEKGIIKACSMGIAFKEKDLIFEGEELVVAACELREVSICGVPSNASAVVLYDEKGNLLSEKQIKEICLSVKTTNTFNNKSMKQLAIYLHLDANADEAALITAVKEIEAKLTASENEKAKLKAKVSALEQAETDRKKAVLTAEIEKAVKDGRLDEAGKAPILEMTHEAAMTLLKALPARKSVKDQMKSDESQLSAYDKMSWEELDKGNHLAKLKMEFPDYYRERFDRKFKK